MKRSLWLIAALLAWSCQGGPLWDQAVEAVKKKDPAARELLAALWQAGVPDQQQARWHFLNGQALFAQAQGKDQPALAAADASFVRVLDWEPTGPVAEAARHNLQVIRALLDPKQKDRQNGQENGQNQGQNQGQDQNQDKNQGGKENSGQPKPGQKDGPNGQSGQSGQQDGKDKNGQATAGKKPEPGKDLSQAVQARPAGQSAELSEALKNDDKRRTEKTLLLQGGVTPVEKDW